MLKLVKIKDPSKYEGYLEPCSVCDNPASYVAREDNKTRKIEQKHIFLCNNCAKTIAREYK